MTLATASYLTPAGNNRSSWAAPLDSSSSTAKEVLGSIRWDVHPIWGVRGFEYVKFHFAATAGEWCTQLSNVALTATAGSTTSLTCASVTADIYIGALLRIKDDAGGSGAAPEGELGRIIKTTSTVVTIDSNDAFSAAVAASDTAEIIFPTAVQQTGSGDPACRVKGVSLVAQTQYYYGWVQFAGLCPIAKLVAAGTAVTGVKGLIAAASGLATISSTSDRSLIIGGLNTTTVASDQVKRTDLVTVCCGHQAQPFISA